MQETSKIVRRTPKDTRIFSPKDRIDHFRFGLGTVVEVNERHTTIAFDESGTRKFVTSMVKLAPSDTPAPARRRRTGKKKKVSRSG